MPFWALLILPVLVYLGDGNSLFMEVIEEGIVDCEAIEVLRWGPEASDLIEEAIWSRVTVSRCDVNDFFVLGRDGALQVRVRRS